MTASKPSVLSLDQLSEAVRAGVVLALEERTSAAVDGGALIATSPLIPTTTMGYIAPRPTFEPFAY